MMRPRTIFLSLLCLPILFLGGLATWTWLTLPPDLDPVAIPSVPGSPAPDAYRTAVDEGRALARTLLAEEKLPGLSVAVAVEGEVVWAEGFRWADIERETPVTPQTRFRIGAVSELFLATAAGILVDQGRLDLDAPVHGLVPAFPEKAWPVTTRHLLSHTGGLRPHRGEGGILRGQCADADSRVAAFAAQPLVSTPGSEHRYSTRHPVLAGAVVSTVAGESYLSFLERTVLTPLGLGHTTAEVAGRPAPDAATPYYPRLALDPKYGLQDCPDIDLSCYLPAVGFLSTPTDLVRFAAALMDGDLLEADTWMQLQRPVRLASGEFLDQALGWTVLDAPLGHEGKSTRILGHGLGEVARRSPISAETVGGQVAGGTAALAAVPEHRIAIAVASNVSAASNVPALAKRLADVFVRGRSGR